MSPSANRISNLNNTYRQNAHFPDNSVRISEVNKAAEDDREHVLGSGHAQPSLDINAPGSSVQFPLIRNENMRFRHKEYDITGLSRARQAIQRSDQPFESEVKPMSDSSLVDGPLGSPILDPILPAPNPEAYVTVKGKEKERRHSDWGYYTGYPASTSVAVRKAVIAAQIATSNADIDKFQYTRIATSEASVDQLIAAETQENIMDETHYHSELVSRLTSIYTK